MKNFVRFLRFNGKINNRVEYVRFDMKEVLVRINDDMAIMGILPSVWSYLENGYQVVMKYLVDRKKSELSQEDMDGFAKLVEGVTRKVINKQEVGEVR